MVDTHSYKLSPFGPALQLGGGSSVISASSFCILFAEVLSAFDIFGLALVSRGSLTGVVVVAAVAAVVVVAAGAPLASELLELGPAPGVDIRAAGNFKNSELQPQSYCT